MDSEKSPNGALLEEDNWELAEFQGEGELEGIQFLRELNARVHGPKGQGGTQWPASVQRKQMVPSIQGGVSEPILWANKVSFPSDADPNSLTTNAQRWNAHVLEVGEGLMREWQGAGKWPAPEAIYGWQSRYTPLSEMSLAAQETFGPILFPFEARIVGVVHASRERLGLPRQDNLRLSLYVSLHAGPFTLGQGLHTDTFNPNTYVALLSADLDEDEQVEEPPDAQGRARSGTTSTVTTTTTVDAPSGAADSTKWSWDHFKEQCTEAEQYEFLAGETAARKGLGRTAQPATRVYKPSPEHEKKLAEAGADARASTLAKIQDFVLGPTYHSSETLAAGDYIGSLAQCLLSEPERDVVEHLWKPVMGGNDAVDLEECCRDTTGQYPP